MMILTDNGLLKTKETLHEIGQMAKGKIQDVHIWWCPFGNLNPRFILRREVFDEVYEQFLKLGEKERKQDEDSEWQFNMHTKPHKRVLWERLEEFIWQRMDVLFYELSNAPSPSPDPREIAKNWGNFIMWRLTKHGDEPGLTDDPTEAQLERVAELKKLMLKTPGCNQPECGCADGLRQQKIDALKVQL